MAATAAVGQGLEIVSAQYGAGGTWIDVAARLTPLVRDGGLVATVDVPTLGADPVPGVVKQLRVRYRSGGQENEAVVSDGETLRINSGSSNPSPAENRFSVSDLFSDRPAVAPSPVAPVTPAASLRILSARYYYGAQGVDVRDRVQALIRDDRLSAKITNQVMGSDPAIGKTKKLDIRYEYRGAVYDTTVSEDKTLNLPDPSARPVEGATSVQGSAPASSTNTVAPSSVLWRKSPESVGPLGTAGKLRVFYARYGAGSNWVDVRERLRPFLKEDGLSVAVNIDTMGTDPSPGAAKSLIVTFEVKGRTFERTVGDGQTLSLP